MVLKYVVYCKYELYTGNILVILTAYAMSRFYFNGKNALMKTTMVLGMFPSFMGMIAVYLLMTQFNLINQLWDWY